MTPFEARLADLSSRFRERARRDLDLIDRALSHQDQDALWRISHGLAGTAAIFGHPELGDAARHLEDAIDAKIEWCRLAELSGLLRDHLQSIGTGAESPQ